MGSEHYCLRWNNHQSNLLGVFSQLLESESLVDVTLACTEGPSIRAHKVVLSACSSYFQALFLDHPNRHPIVILKDVRFAELRTLVDFMYKGEVNVEYCQLSALLKTAESLKVKGLADMTNINAAAVQSSKEEEQQSPPQAQLPAQQQQQPQQQQQSTTGTSSSSTTTTTTTTTATATALTTPAANEPMLQDAQDERLHQHHHQHHQHSGTGRSSDSKDSRERNNDRDRDCRDRDRDRERDREKERDKRDTSSRERELQQQQQQALAQQQRDREQRERDREHNLSVNECSTDDVEISECPASPPTSATTRTSRGAASSPCPGPLALDRPRSRRDSDSAASLEETRGSLSPLSVHSGPSDMSLSNNNSSAGAGGIGGGVTPVTIPISSLPQSRLPSPHSTEPLAGPSGLPPVQQVPLSLKKEVDWERSTEERSASSEMSSDYRLPPDPELMGMDERVFACMYCGASFLHQSKLTRHILSHSLESLKYREQAAHLQLQAQLGLEVPTGLHLPAEAHYPGAAGLGPIEPMDLELAAVHSDPSSGVVLCKFCGKSFPDVGSLISHLPAHTGDRPFKCEFCGKAFKLRHHMKDHCRVHTGERPFRCSLCGKTFSRSTILKAHEKTHYPKYVRKFLSPSPVDPNEEEAATPAPNPNPPNPHAPHH